MTQDVNALIAQATAATEKLEDQTKVTEGGFERETPPAGKTPARFIGYVELGKRKQKPFQGKPKPDADEVRLYFELLGKKHVREVEVNGETKQFSNVITVKLAKKLNDRAAFTKLFKKMTYGRDSITHMVHMLGEGFIIDVIHNTVEKDGKSTVYANMKTDDGTWTISAPSVEDPITNEVTQVPVPAPLQPIKVLLWDAPSKEQWESIFIDGTRTVKDAKGNEVEKSNNWLQEDIVQNAVNFPGSALEQIVGGVADLDMEPDAPAEQEAPQEEAPKSSDDVLADLFL